MEWTGPAMPSNARQLCLNGEHSHGCDNGYCGGLTRSPYFLIVSKLAHFTLVK